MQLNKFNPHLKMDDTRLKILVFSWNTASVGLCETLDSNVKNKNRSGFTTWRWDSDLADFWVPLKKRIKDESPDVVAIGFQEDRRPGSYFHSHLLPEEMEAMGYYLLRRMTQMGVGVTTYKNLVNNGDPMVRGLRTSIYIKNKHKHELAITEQYWSENGGKFEYNHSSPLTRSKGASAIYMSFPSIGNLVFINCHLPINASSLIEANRKKNPMIRQNHLNETNTAFNHIFDQAVLYQKMLRNVDNDNNTHILYFGDFNYRLVESRNAVEVGCEIMKAYYDDNPEILTKLYSESDELLHQMRKENIYTLSEGVEGEGPRFLPTCKMVKGRRPLSKTPFDDTVDDYGFLKIESSIKPSIPFERETRSRYNLGKFNQRNPSWCDRILYTDQIKNSSSSDRKLVCTAYESFDEGSTMSKSDHAGVLGLFIL